jgi:hypothetical protein
MKIKLAPIGAGILLLLSSCHEHASSENKEVATEQNAPPYTATDSTAGEYKDEDRGNPLTSQQPAANPDWDRKIIRTATLRLEVKDFNKYYSLLRDAIRRTGGYVATEQQNSSGYSLENTVTIKVPVAQFEEAMNLISNVTGVEKVMDRNITSQDVTTEVVDTKSRLETKRQVRLRYLELLQQAKKMEDILKVQEEINDIQEQMDMAASRVNYLNHSSAMSTIQLTFFQVLTTPPPTPAGPSFLDKLWLAFEKGWELIKGIILGIITIWPLLLGGLVLWFLLRKKVIKSLGH